MLNDNPENIKSINKNNATAIFIENDEPVLGGITVNTSKTTYFDDSTAARLCTINYQECWDELRNRLQRYLDEKKGNNYKDPYGRYCIALAIDDIFRWMEDIENNCTKNW